MTRKHFQIIADAIKIADSAAYSNPEEGRVAFIAKFEIANNIAKALKAENPRFDRDNFMTACGL